MLKRFFTYILLLTMSLRPAYYIGTVAYFETHLSEIIQEFCVNKEVPELQCNAVSFSKTANNSTTNKQRNGWTRICTD